MKHSIIALIPARGGSKGILRKNIKLFSGKPLIAYTIEEVKRSKYVDRIFVSTEDEEIAKISNAYNAEVIKRPVEYAQDSSNSSEVIKHALSWLEKEERYSPEIILFLQPTSPLRTTDDINKALELYLNNECESVVSVYKSQESPYWNLTIKNQFIEPLFGWEHFKGKRRQDLPITYSLNGAIYITSTKKYLENGSFFNEKTLPYIMPMERSIDIDNDSDFEFAETIMRKRNEGSKKS
jgi:CMP-N,N'-diacetyllegionaminic acid synthase